jgi:ACS family tartrate transporter-like MFS transporter
MSDDRVFAKVAWRLIPFMALLFFLNLLDRLNVGFAALTMNKDLGFTPSVFGFGAGALFVGYLLLQVPGAAMLERFGVRRGVFCILAVWGALSASCAFVQGPTSFYVLRFLLGASEAALFPSMMFYLTLWFPRECRVRYAAGFVSAAAYSGVIGGPVSSLILANADGLAGLHGWQWLFLLEGLPAFLLAFPALKLLPDSPQNAAWLSPAEKQIIAARLDPPAPQGKRDVFSGLRDWRVRVLALAGFAHGLALYGLQLWLPLIVQDMGFSTRATGFVVAAPNLAAAIVMVYWGRSSDKRNERVWHLVLAWLLCASGLAIASATQATAIALVGLTFAMVGILTAILQLFTLPSMFLRGPGGASAAGLINALVSLGGATGPAVIGLVREQTGGYAPAMAAIACGLLLSSTLVLSIRRSLAPSAVETPSLIPHPKPVEG